MKQINTQDPLAGLDGVRTYQERVMVAPSASPATTRRRSRKSRARRSPPTARARSS